MVRIFTAPRPFSIVGAVERTFFKEFLSRFSADGTYACPCGQTHRLGTRTVVIEHGALEESARSLVAQHGSGVRLWVLSDENTEAAAAARWKAALPGGRVVPCILPGRPKPYPTLEMAQSLAAEARAASPDLVVGVGGGVISDLVKRVSLEIEKPNWSVGTAASMDAYPSATVSFGVRGYKSALPGRISETIVCDLDVIGRAPREMFAAGIGDLLGKFIAYLDWNLSRIMTGEHFCPVAAELALDSARTALSAARALRGDPARAVRSLTDAAVSSGLAMQAVTASRPAASSEHTLSHFWETTHAAGVESLNLHGVLVGAASRVMLPGYRALWRELETVEPDVRRRLDRYDAETPWQESLEEGLRPYAGKVAEEMNGRAFDRGTLAQRLETFRTRRLEILALGNAMLGEMTAMVEALDGLEYPFGLRDLRIPPESAYLPLRNIRFLRRRYSAFELAYELGIEEVLRGAAAAAVAAGT
jgi:glycerol-1-phosphate dehydrogenase [NAD(P)+]